MTKSSIIFSPGLLLLVLIAFISQDGGGVRGQSCRPGSGNNFGTMYGCSGCESHCNSIGLPAIYNGMTGLPVISGQCYEIAKAPGRYVCLCCVAFTSVPSCAPGTTAVGAGAQSSCSNCDQFGRSNPFPAGYPYTRSTIKSSTCFPAPDNGPYVVCNCCAK